LGFAFAVKSFRQRYNSKLRIAGIVPSLTYQANLRDDEKDLLKQLDERLLQEGFGRKVLPLNVPRRAREAVITGTQSLYDSDDNCRAIFNRLAESLHLEPPMTALQQGMKNESKGFSVSA
jgi:hypothetical protein